MVDFATLILDADSRGLKTGEQALNSIASTAERTENRVNKANDNVSKGMQQVGKQSIFAGQQSRMMAMQLSQVAQQASATGNWVQALAIQLPDLALGFGTIGIAAGVVAGALLPIIANMVMSGDEADRLKDTMEALEGSMEAYSEAVENASQPIDNLISKFGAQAEGAQKVYEALRNIRELEFQENLRAAQTAIAETLEGLQSSIDRFQMAAQMPDFLRPEAIGMMASETAALANEFGITAVQATRINDALDQLAAANGPQQAADAARLLADEIGRARDEGATLSPEMRNIQKEAYQASLEAQQFANMISQATGGANSLAGAMGGVADEAARAAQNAAAAASAIQSALVGGQLAANSSLDPLNGFNRTPFEDEQQIMNRRAEATKSQYQLTMERLSKSSGSGRRSGGGSAAKVSDEAREAKRIFEDTRTAAEKYATELEDLKGLHEMGYLDADTYSRAIAKVGEEYKNASDEGNAFEGITSDIKEGILDVILEGENLSDTFKDIAKSIARAALEAALFGSGPFASGGSSGGGGLLSGLFGGFTKLFSFDGGGSTGSGSRSGGLDGKGGFPAILHPNETVVDHTKGGSGGSQVQVSVVSRFDGNGNFETAVEGISQKTVQSAAPGIVSAANQQVVPTMAKYQANKAGGDWRS